MTFDHFESMLNYLIEKQIKTKLSSKNKEYARGNNKLYNFYRSGEIDKKSPIEVLRGLDLKHRTSISDMLDDINNKVQQDDKPLWEEKITDHINYCILLLGLLADRYGWDYQNAENPPKEG